MLVYANHQLKRGVIFLFSSLSPSHHFTLHPNSSFRSMWPHLPCNADHQLIQERVSASFSLFCLPNLSLFFSFFFFFSRSALLVIERQTSQSILLYSYTARNCKLLHSTALSPAALFPLSSLMKVAREKNNHLLITHLHFTQLQFHRAHSLREWTLHQLISATFFSLSTRFHRVCDTATIVLKYLTRNEWSRVKCTRVSSDRPVAPWCRSLAPRKGEREQAFLFPFRPFNDTFNVSRMFECVTLLLSSTARSCPLCTLLLCFLSLPVPCLKLRKLRQPFITESLSLRQSLVLSRQRGEKSNTLAFSLSFTVKDLLLRVPMFFLLLAPCIDAV